MAFLTELQIKPAKENFWRLTAPLIYEFPDGTVTIIVPEGFECDMESIPWYIRWYLPENSIREQAAVVHDWLYTTHECTRELSDQLFKQVLLDIGVSKRTANLMYQAVRLFGGPHWKAKERKS